ncbi:hypothetical protein Rhopal_004442-T1 [Rhodotorula paludigena]|uniref:RRM domain-containing protein n=1 Tax=Rhodotorula paludigena TaxID=86838 RepID=A0AAV5GPF3_9BASI|nr:hypothetical protein Rhopal_004442-T1 [Rhodotorula paludigena]
MLTDADDTATDLRDLLTAEDILDRIVTSITDSDVCFTLVYLKELDNKGEPGLINQGHSQSGVTPLVAAGSKEHSRTASLLVRILLAKGAKLPSVDDNPEWVGQVQAWAIELIDMEGGAKKSTTPANKDVEALLNMDLTAVDEWCREHLTPPPDDLSRDAADQLGGYTTDDDFRASSLPLEARTKGRLPNESTADHRASSPADLFRTGRREASAPLPLKAEQSTPKLAYVDLTGRSPSPVPKEEEQEPSLAGGAPPSPPNSRAGGGKKRAASRSRSRSPNGRSAAPQPRAHLRVDNLPEGYTSEQLSELFSSVPGVVDVEVHVSKKGALWGFVSLASLATAQHAHATKNGTYCSAQDAANSDVLPLALTIYAADGHPLDPHREVEPVVNNPTGAPYAPVASPSQQRQPLPPRPYGAPAGASSGRGFGGASAGFGGSGAPRYFPRPVTPFIFTAAELARRVYCGSLHYGISYEEVARLFSEKAGVVARVLKVMNAQDGSHSFAFVQLPDAITADHAIKVLHGTVYNGHLLQIEHVNELGHRWLFSLSLHGLPPSWHYQDVSDFLISTIGSFAGLIVRVELRYETELRWASSELDGLLVDGRPVRAEIEQARVRQKVERERAYNRLVDHTLPSGGNDPDARGGAGAGGGRGAAAGGGAYDPRNPGTGTASAMQSVGGATGTYEQQFPPLAGSVTPGGRSRPPPPPPPPPAPACDADADADAYNPFSLSFLK